MNLVAAFVRNPVKVTVGALLLGLFGAIALDRMPMQLVPEVQTPVITVETAWPGASPQEIEREIIQEQEEQLKGVEGVLKMSAECMDSRGTITLEFAAGEDMSAALLRVNTRLQQVREYPETADEPVLSTSGSSDQAIAWFILRPRLPTAQDIAAFQDAHPELREALEPARRAFSTGQLHQRLKRAAAEHEAAKALLPPDIDLTKYRRFAEDVIEARFERVGGVSNSNVLGGQEDELQVVLDPQRLAGRGLTVADVRRALRARNVDVSAGDYWEGKRRYVVRTLGKFKGVADVAETILREDAAGTVYVRDVAEVRTGYKKPDGVVRNMGTTVLAINCIRDRGANVLAVMEGLYAARQELNEGILRTERLQLDQVYDETEYIHSAVGLLQDNIFLAGALTILVLLVFLRSARSTLVIALAIPTSLIGTFLMLEVLGRSLNVVSLAGLAFAVGMLVDNAVVVLENIYRHYQLGARRFQAAVDGTREVWGAVVASTLTTLAVFVPILFIEEEAGQLFMDIALAISCSVGLSLIVSVTLIPMLTARILSRQGSRSKRGVLDIVFKPLDPVGRGFVRGVVGTHGWLERGVLRQLGAATLLVGAAWFVSVTLFPKLEYLPNGNRNLVFGIVLPPPGYNLDELVALGETVERQVAPYWEVDPGSPEARELGATPVAHFFFVARGRQVFMGMRAHDGLSSGKLVPLMQRIGASLPGTFLIASQASLFERGLTGGRTIDIEITGPDLRRLVGIGGRVMGQAMGLIPSAQVRPVPSLDLSNPEVHVRPRWERAAAVGLTADELGYTVNSLVDGAYAGDYIVDGEKIDLTLVGQDRFASRLQDLGELPIVTPSGALVPLRSLAEIGLTSGPEQINRRERERAITISVRPPETMALEEALDTIVAKIVTPLEQDGSLAGGYRIRMAGTADKLQATWKAMSFNLLLAVLITYLLMAALFESWLHPFVILFSVPLGAAGGIAGLAALNRFVLPAGTLQPLDVLTMIGFVILVGTVVNNAILIVHQSLVHIREDKDDVRTAVRRSVATRIRPIFMTVTTTVCGLLPLVLRPGAGSELYRGLGSVLVGGLLVSTVFTLFLVPILFRLTMAMKAGLARLLRLQAAEA
jgi:HAE1 family hydrophobic/amphiphilic exporter-1